MENEELLGEQVVDTLTGLKGIATAVCRYVHGCDHVGIQPPANNKTGTVPPLVWSDSPQVELVKKKKIVTKKKPKVVKTTRRLGGPAAHPGGRAHPGVNDAGYGG
jgi:hypothetical protein